MWQQEYGDLDYEIVVRSDGDVLIWSRDEVSVSVGDQVLVVVVITEKIIVWDQVLVMVVIAGKITVWLRGNPFVRESEGLSAQVWLHCMSNMLLFAFKEPCQNRRWLHRVSMLCLHWIWSVVYFQHSFMMTCHAWIDYAMIDDMLWFAIAILGTCLIRHDSIMLVDAMMLFELNYL